MGDLFNRQTGLLHDVRDREAKRREAVERCSTGPASTIALDEGRSMFWALRIRSALLVGNFAACRDLVDQSEREATAADRLLICTTCEMRQVRADQCRACGGSLIVPPVRPEELPIADTSIDYRTVNTLEERGVFYVSELLELTDADLLGIPNFGDKTLAHVDAALIALGLSTRDDRTGELISLRRARSASVEQTEDPTK